MKLGTPTKDRKKGNRVAFTLQSCQSIVASGVLRVFSDAESYMYSAGCASFCVVEALLR